MTLPSVPRFGLARALTISLVLHFLLLWPALPGRPTKAATASLVATLRPIRPSVAPATVRAMMAEQGQRRSEQQDDNSEPRTASVHRPVKSSPARTSNLTPSAPSRSDTVPLEPTPSSLASSDGIDADGLRVYRLALAREAKRYKRYPAQAIEAGWTGTVEVRVSVPGVAGIGGPVPEMTKSSGHAVLDAAALDMLRLALPETAVPTPLRGQTFTVNLPLVFELPD